MVPLTLHSQSRFLFLPQRTHRYDKHHGVLKIHHWLNQYNCIFLCLRTIVINMEQRKIQINHVTLKLFSGTNFFSNSKNTTESFNLNASIVLQFDTPQSHNILVLILTQDHNVNQLLINSSFMSSLCSVIPTIRQESQKKKGFKLLIIKHCSNLYTKFENPGSYTTNQGWPYNKRFDQY